MEFLRELNLKSVNKNKILAVDYGKRKIGLAVTDDSALMAFGRGFLLNLSQKTKVDKIVQLIQKENAGKLIVGLPLGQNGEETSQTKEVRTFVSQISDLLARQKLEIPVEFIDESFSTFEAQNMLKEQRMAGVTKQVNDDEMSAIVLLNRYLEQKK